MSTEDTSSKKKKKKKTDRFRYVFTLDWDTHHSKRKAGNYLLIENYKKHTVKMQKNNSDKI